MIQGSRQTVAFYRSLVQLFSTFNVVAALCKSHCNVTLSSWSSKKVWDVSGQHLISSVKSIISLTLIRSWHDDMLFSPGRYWISENSWIRLRNPTACTPTSWVQSAATGSNVSVGLIKCLFVSLYPILGSKCVCVNAWVCIKGPTLYIILDLYLSSWTPMEQTHIIIDFFV